MNAQPVPDTRLRGKWLVLTRGAWLVIAALSLGLDLISMSTMYATYQTLCTGFPSCANLQLTEKLAQQLPGLGWSISSYALYFTVFVSLTPLVFFLVAAVIFWRRSDDRMALFVAFMLLTWGGGGSGTLGTGANPILSLLATWLQVLGNASIALFIFLFPDGRFVPRWTRWLAPIIIAREVLGVLTDNALVQIAFFIMVPIGLFIQIYKYRRVSTVIQREQTKWVIFGLVLGISGYATTLLYIVLTIPTGQPDNVVTYIVGGTLLGLFLLLIPISIGVAILRSHLWDIDMLIRRTLVYSILTGLLALIYFGGVVLVQQLTRSITETSDLAIVVSTLVIAALFLPLRRRVQNVIDRRFYRRKYDAAKTLAAFGATVRDGVELEKLTNELLNVVNETMQPKSVQLWLRPTLEQRQREREV